MTKRKDPVEWTRQPDSRLSLEENEEQDRAFHFSGPQRMSSPCFNCKRQRNILDGLSVEDGCDLDWREHIREKLGIGPSPRDAMEYDVCDIYPNGLPDDVWCNDDPEKHQCMVPVIYEVFTGRQWRMLPDGKLEWLD